MSKVTDVGVVDDEDVADVPELSDEVRVALTDIAGVLGADGRGDVVVHQLDSRIDVVRASV